MIAGELWTPGRGVGRGSVPALTVLLCPLLFQLLGHERPRCHLVGDQGTCARFHNGKSLLLCGRCDDVKITQSFPKTRSLRYTLHRSTLCSSSASSSSWSKSYNPQISVEMNPVFTCKSVCVYFLVDPVRH